MDGVVVPLRVGGKKMKKRRELDALVAQSLAKRACNAKRQAGNGINSQDQLLSQSTDDQDDSNWSKVQVSRCKTKQYSFLRTCGPLAFLTSIFILFGFMYWLYFDLRQQIYEHRMKIEEVSASSQFLPDALQRWHEATKLLEHNQTNVNNKLLEIQYRMENFEKELAEVRDNFNKRDANSEKEKLSVLQNSVGNFGAKIKDLSVDVETLKENVNKLKIITTENKINLTKMMTKLDFIMANYSFPANNDNETFTNLLNNVTKMLTDELKNLSAQVISINNVLSQKTQGLEDDIHAQKPKFDALIENFANMSSHVASIEDDWTKYKQKTMNLEEATIKFNAELNFLKNNSDRLAISVNEIQNEQRRKQSLENRNQILDTIGRGIQPNTRIFKIRKDILQSPVQFLNTTSPKKIPSIELLEKVTITSTPWPSTIPSFNATAVPVPTTNSTITKPTPTADIENVIQNKIECGVCQKVM